MAGGRRIPTSLDTPAVCYTSAGGPHGLAWPAGGSTITLVILHHYTHHYSTTSSLFDLFFQKSVIALFPLSVKYTAIQFQSRLEDVRMMLLPVTSSIPEGKRNMFTTSKVHLPLKVHLPQGMEGRGSHGGCPRQGRGALVYSRGSTT